ncbi:MULTISPECIES: D-alanyl-D-alanine carboxypeptidase family protein [unclassified Butyrivibrio]|uniref:D-alanyl-D-alanine carboxypeptidase family protein n=1 Tax=unclassified Butyrivibrio TaxID=2639466 RepID=UPI0004184DF0|nr:MULTISPECIES: D-alanyl-D-alanine carboxypeptidase [unclassified Butyrivibrio]
MRCINKTKKCLIAISLILASVTGLAGCAPAEYAFAYSLPTVEYGENTGLTMKTFASELCVTNGDIGDSLSLSENTCCGLFDLKNKKTLYAKNAQIQLDPASLTKVMTAIVALKKGSLDQMLIADSEVYINEPGAQLINLKEGDSMTLDQALHILLLYSANDVAVLIAKGISGSVEAFVEDMNNEALAIGATNTHFMNPNGLTADNHYTSVYDMYLMFNEALKYEKFNEIIGMSTYSTQFGTASGELRDVEVKNTNGYINGAREMPSGITVLGGKTGTTSAAGHCLTQLASDTSGNNYIAIIMRAEDTETLYTEMSDLLLQITNG